MEFIEVLDELKARRNLKSDNQAAVLLKMNRKTLGQYRHGERSPDAYACVRLALELDIDPLLLLAAVQAKAEKGDRQAFWADFFQFLSTGCERVPVWLFTAFCAIACAGSGNSQSSVRLKSTLDIYTVVEGYVRPHYVNEAGKALRNKALYEVMEERFRHPYHSKYASPPAPR